MSNTVDPRFAPPQAHVADLVSEEIVVAGRGVRLLAAIVDTLIVGSAIWAAAMFPVFRDTFLQETQRSMAAWSPLSMVLGIVVFLVIQGWPLLTRGQTIGKMLFKLRIVRSDGAKVNAWRMLGLRYGVGLVLAANTAVALVYSLIDSLLIFRASRQCLHDSIADTRVIKL